MIHYDGGTITPLEGSWYAGRGDIRHTMISFAHPRGSLHLKYMKGRLAKSILHHGFAYIVVPAGVFEYPHSVSNK
jgi:hypothetical protein